ncbi:MAG: uroporphyrinogen decarboxylase family protein [Rectinemataceae bacterium]
MTSRERVRAVLAHKQPDRVPLDLWGSASRVHTDLYKRMAGHFGYNELGPLVRKGTTTEYVDYRLSDLFHCDFRHIIAGKLENFKSYTDDEGNTYDEWGIGKKLFDGFWGITRHPLKNAEAIEEIMKHKWPDPCDPGRIAGIETQAKDWYENTEFSLSTTTAVSGLFMELGQYLRGDSEFLMDLYINKEIAHCIIGKLTDIFEEMYAFYITPVAKYIDWIEFTEDFGMQDRAFFSREVFREFFFEPHKRLFTSLKRIAPQAKIFFHSCGSVRELIPEFIEMGIDVLNSLQPQAAGMDSAALKRDFGKELVFHSGIDIQGAMRGSRQDVVDEVKKRIDAFGPGGGYILAPSNHFLGDVPIENIITMYETAYEYGRY